jgi:hypothetical protein
MLGTFSDRMAMCRDQTGRELVGHWTNEMSTPVLRHIVAALSPSEAPELSVIHASREQNLIWVWTLQSEFVAENLLRADACEQSDLIRKGEDH